jgi:restriction system protein
MDASTRRASRACPPGHSFIDVSPLGSRIVLIDRKQLARLMIRYNVGCRDKDLLHIKQIDEAFFEEGLS